MPSTAVCGVDAAPLSPADALARRMIEMVELGALDAGVDTMRFGRDVASVLSLWFAEVAS